MYGLWLFKEIRTEYGYCKVNIYRKAFTGSAIEIGGFVGDSLSIALENLDTITAPVGKSVCSFAIYDTEQVEYDDLFSPDATAFKVVVSTRVDGGAYVTRWSGYVTPDFFAENLSYRTPISISARDNIGYLNDVDFDLTATTVTVRELIQSAFKRIAEDYPMSLSFVTQKQTAEGILAIDATISTTLLREMSWGEALETILHDLGLQMRWVDNNTIAVLDLSQIPEYYATQGFNFIDASGYREIVPAWRELSQEQDFGLKENFFEGWLREDNITFVKSVVMRPPNATNWTTDIAYYVPNNWGVARDIYTTDPSYYGSKFGKKIFFTGVSDQNPTTTYFSWRQQIQSSIVPMKMSFKAFNSVLYPSEKYASLTTPSGRRLVAYNPKDAFHGQKVGEYLQIGLKANVLLHSGLKTYILKSEWVEISDDGAGWQLDFTLPKVELSYVEGNQATAVEPREEEITINIATIPYDGELEFRIYGWYIVGKHNYWEDDYSVTNYTFDWLKCLAYINEPTFSFNTDEADSGRETNVMIAEAHNIKQEETYTFGQTFSNGGGLNAYAGALVGTDGNELIGFQRNANATNYNLLELVGRELIHFNKKNYNRLSGTIKNLSKEPLMFNRLFVREGKKYAPYNYSLNVISNEMNITSMQEVEPYETATFNTIDSQITTGGGTVSGGNNTILQYSEEAGNEKRLYELQTATEQEKNDAYVLVDKAGFPEARKVHISELGGFDVSELEQYLESNGYATLKRIWEVDSANAVVRTTYNVVSAQEIISGRRASGASSDVTGGGGISQVTAQMIVDALGYVPYSSQNPSGYITSSALNGYAKLTDIPSLSGYATESFVTSKGYITAASLTKANVGLGNVQNFGVFNQGFFKGQTQYALVNNSVLEIGNRIDFHIIESASNDYEVSLRVASGEVTKRVIYLPSAEGTLALVSQIPTALKSPYALTFGNKTYDGSEANTITAADLGALSKDDASKTYQTLISLSNKLPYTYISGTPSLATVATSGKYSDLSGLPTIPTNNNQLTNGAGYITSAALNGFATQSWVEGKKYLTAIPSEYITESELYTTLGGYQTKISSSNKIAYSNISGTPSLASVATSGKYSDLSGVPTSLPASDVAAWAKAATKPTYTFSEITSKPTTLYDYSLPDVLYFQDVGAEYAPARFFSTAIASKAANKYIEWWQSGVGWFNHQAGKYIVAGANSAQFLKGDGSLDSTAYLPLSGGTIGALVVNGTLDTTGNATIGGVLVAKGGRLRVNASNTVNSFGFLKATAYTSSLNRAVLDIGSNYGGSSNVASESVDVTALSIYRGIVGVGRAYTYEELYANYNSNTKLYVDGGIANTRTHAASHWDALKIISVGSWSAAPNYVNGIGVTDGSGVVGRFGISYNGTEGGYFSVRDLYTSAGGYASSGEVFKVVGNGNVYVYGNLITSSEVISSRRASSSDRRLKDAISYLSAEQSLNLVRLLRPAEWDWKDDGKHSMGFIAQDVEQYMPYAVTSIKDDELGYKLNLQYDQFIALAIGGVQAVDNEVRQLKKEVKDLKEKLAKYEAQWQ